MGRLCNWITCIAVLLSMNSSLVDWLYFDTLVKLQILILLIRDQPQYLLTVL